MAADTYIQDHNANSLTTPVTDAVTITPSDAVDGTGNIGYIDADTLSKPTKGVWVGTAGNITVQLLEGDAPVQFMNVPEGHWDVRAVRIALTGTTANNLLALY